MKEYSILKKNEEEANIFIAGVMRITIVFCFLLLIMCFCGLFSVQKKTIVVATIISTIFFALPTIWTNILKRNETWMKYANVLCAVVATAAMVYCLGNNVVITFVYPLIICSFYFSKQLVIITTGASVIVFSAVQMVAIKIASVAAGKAGLVYDESTLKMIKALNLDIAADYTYVNFKLAFLCCVLVRAIQMVALAFIFYYLSKRTSGLLANMMGAEEQSEMLDKMTRMTDTSREVTNVLASSVEQLSETDRKSVV